MDYTTLIGAKTVEGSIKNWVNRGDIPSGVIVEEAEAWLWAEGMLRVREMIATEAVTFSTASNEQDFPSDGLDPVQFLPYEWETPLTYKHPQLFRVITGTTGDIIEGTPTEWALVGTVMQTNYLPDTEFSGVLTYYARPTALQTVLTNFITTRYPRMFRHALLGAAFDHMKDFQRSAHHFTMAQGLIEQIKVQDDFYLRGSEL